MKRIALGIATVFVCGTLFSAATCFAAWQLWQLNTLLYQAAVPGALGPFVTAPPSSVQANVDYQCEPTGQSAEDVPSLAALHYTPALAPPPAETKKGEHKQVVYITVEAEGAPIEVDVDDD
jgi:hypothetical protein